MARKEGAANKAVGLYRKSLCVERQYGMIPWDERLVIASTLSALAGLEEGAPTPERAARLMGAAQALIDASGQMLPYDERIEYEQSLASARARLADEVAWQAAWQEGRAMTLEQAIAYALEPQDTE
jgi:hypothetical protein